MTISFKQQTTSTRDEQLDYLVKMAAKIPSQQLRIFRTIDDWMV